MERILYETPVQLFQGMWASGVKLNCNIYWDCTTGCRYCYVRLNREVYKQYYREPASGDSYEGAVAFGRLLERVHGPKYDDADARQFFLHERAPMIVSNNSDLFSSHELEHGYTRQYLSLLADVDQPLMILTKAQAWSKLDQDAYLALLKRFTQLWVSVTLTTDSDECSRTWEPNAPLPSERLAFIRQLTEVGIPVAVHCVPFIPAQSFTAGAWDDPETYAPYFDAVKDAGAYAVTLGTLCVDAGKKKGMSPELSRYITENAWCQNEADRPYRAFLVDSSIELEIDRMWRALAQERGLRFGAHPTYTSQFNEDGCLDEIVCPPAWLDRSGSWTELALELRRLQREHGEPILLTTADVANWLAYRLSWREHVFSWASWRDCIPHRFGDADYRFAVDAMPKEVTVEDVLHFQHQQLCRWSDTLWADLSTAPVAFPSGNQATDAEGNYYMSFDVKNPRDSWAACRSGHGWEGRPASEFDLEEVP